MTKSLKRTDLVTDSGDVVNTVMRHADDGGGKVMRKSDGGVKELEYGVENNSKISKQLERRGWDNNSISEVTQNPYTTRSASNKSNGNSATVYYNRDGSYVVKDDVTGNVIQISNKNDPNWIPDDSIINPYVP